jgi:sulfur carrier protein
MQKEFKMKILVNGEEYEFGDASSLSDILNKLSLNGKVMAAAVNMEIVKQDGWITYILNDGDKLELLDFVGGG